MSNAVVRHVLRQQRDRLHTPANDTQDDRRHAQHADPQLKHEHQQTPTLPGNVPLIQGQDEWLFTLLIPHHGDAEQYRPHNRFGKTEQEPKSPDRMHVLHEACDHHDLTAKHVSANDFNSRERQSLPLPRESERRRVLCRGAAFELYDWPATRPGVSTGSAVTNKLALKPAYKQLTTMIPIHKNVLVRAKSCPFIPYDSTNIRERVI